MYDILVVGGGHAGIEAAYIASQFTELKIGIVTLPGVGLASAPCNPSIGGVGKGQVVRELDALGGLTGKLADLSGIQYRVLNESKGYAVHSTRIQIDKIAYSENAEIEINKIENIDVIREKVESIKTTDLGFELQTNCSTWNTKKIIITVGTFFNGRLHTGSTQTEGGRSGCESSNSLGKFFKDIKTVSARFKTGTPARLNIDTIAYKSLEEQPSDDEVTTFHVLHGTNARFLPQVSCYLAYTNPKTMKVIRDNKEKSPMFNGQIKGVGARYCPSIEDKAYRYPDKDKHHVFIEPESHKLNTVYPSGISSSLPEDVQDEMISSIEGLENAKIEQYGYAVEYDVIDTTLLDYSLQHQAMPGLYFAGQVNGTSGYEEAAGQGYIAGVNAALDLLGKEPLVLNRKTSYIGVMIEDLISNLRDEPYRLFTARSENRLFIREDNAILRMKPFREKLSLNKPLDLYLDQFSEKYETYMGLFSETFISPSDSFLKYKGIKIPRRISLAELFKQANLDPIQTLNAFFSHCGFEIDNRLIRCLAISIKYDGYINKANEHYQKVGKLDSMAIDWERICKSENVSFECKQRVERIKPQTFGQLKQIEGIRPATLAAVAGKSY